VYEEFVARVADHGRGMRVGDGMDPQTDIGPLVSGRQLDRVCEEIFGPVLAAMPFDDVEDVLPLANDTQFGLAGGVWTRDLRRAQRVSAGIKAGTVWINCFLMADPALPFGGYKMSGYGREYGREGLEEYLQVKAVLMNVG
jgi:aldehyde dehydrogenase (NAD+)